jgi:hypothetical protein
VLFEQFAEEMVWQVPAANVRGVPVVQFGG